jgi:hypothetical protein
VNPKIKAEHLTRAAAVYVRQFDYAQVTLPVAGVGGVPLSTAGATLRCILNQTGTATMEIPVCPYHGNPRPFAGYTNNTTANVIFLDDLNG